MSAFNKQQEFDEAAKKAEEEFRKLKGLGDEPTPVEVPVESTPAPEAVVPPSGVETPTPAPEPTPEPRVFDEEDYKKKVKAMNAAQKAAADAQKRLEEIEGKRKEEEARLNELIENFKRVQSAPKPQAVAEDEFEDDMPEVSRIAEKKARKILDPYEQRIANLEKLLKEERETRIKIDQEANTRTMLSEIRSVHKDYDDVVNSDEMVAWINNEAPPIYKAIFEGSIPFTAKDAITVLNAFKQTIQPPTPAPSAKKVEASPSAAEIAAPVKVTTPIAAKPNVEVPPTPKELDWFMHNSHKLSREEIVEWDKRLALL